MAKTKEFRALTLKEAWPSAKQEVKTRRLVTLIFSLIVGALLIAGGWPWLWVVPAALFGGFMLHFWGALSNLLGPLGPVICNTCSQRRNQADVSLLKGQNVTGGGRCGTCRHEIGKDS